MARLHRKATRYVTDKIVEGTGHKILRLPPYHCHWNAIELAWGLVRRFYDKHIDEAGSYKEENAMRVWVEALASVTPEVWAKITAKVEKKNLEDYEVALKADTEVKIIDSMDHENEDEEVDDPDP